ncbi:sulfatase-like hydrolase/transferase [Brevibacillus centrosporus]|uniref:sulfatase-like hydrolase/transferase n=1 Tax=Brevibacillus centrosporus TaxID=54910 RepID=UPI002E21A2B2|nr:sulfatase-like hydrolase/transferase [Brevibacillus centrosporus]MED4907338.1 sulfatase-like hydrolase/transferase [Brevibacillus centrosporus]
MSTRLLKKRPHILLIIVDEERFPPVYEGAAIKAWSQNQLQAHRFLRSHGLEFCNHYVSATACCPSRATLFTGQYPSLHGVTQTSGAAKRPADSDMFWLDPNTVPTLGEYFRAAGYRTFYNGKWHFSNADIHIPGTHQSVPSYQRGTGIPDPELVQLYLQADRLEGYGFSGWVGPEPAGAAPHDSGSSAAHGINGRDVVYSTDVISLLHQLEQEQLQQSPSGEFEPWLIVASFVNPHDITLFGDFTQVMPIFRFHVDDSVPDVEPPPTQRETLRTKPRCQSSYRDVFPQAFQPISDNTLYRRLYYQLQKNADQQVMRILQALAQSTFYRETIVVFTSDHGDLLGAHGNLHQKFYCAYEEALHVPFIVHNPLLFPSPQTTRQLSCHVDLLPTLLGLIGADPTTLLAELEKTHSEVRPPVGRNLSGLILGTGTSERLEEPLYFMTEDDVTKGQHQISLLGQPYHSVIPPNQIETVIATVRYNQKKTIWKYSRYYSDRLERDGCTSADEDYELYNLTDDPLESFNLASPVYATPQTEPVRQWMGQLLQEQRAQKRLTPQTYGIRR